jgi:hypothetical protein
MVREVGELGEHTGRFQTATARHAEAIEKADTLESLADVVQSMLEDSRAINVAVTVRKSACRPTARAPPNLKPACATWNPNCAACPTRSPPTR